MAGAIIYIIPPSNLKNYDPYLPLYMSPAGELFCSRKINKQKFAKMPWVELQWLESWYETIKGQFFCLNAQINARLTGENADIRLFQIMDYHPVRFHEFVTDRPEGYDIPFVPSGIFADTEEDKIAYDIILQKIKEVIDQHKK